MIVLVDAAKSWSYSDLHLHPEMIKDEVIARLNHDPLRENDGEERGQLALR